MEPRVFRAEGNSKRLVRVAATQLPQVVLPTDLGRSLRMHSYQVLEWMTEQGAGDWARTQRRQHGNKLLQARLQTVYVDTQLLARKRCHKPCLQGSG